MRGRFNTTSEGPQRLHFALPVVRKQLPQLRGLGGFGRWPQRVVTLHLLEIIHGLQQVLPASIISRQAASTSSVHLDFKDHLSPRDLKECLDLIRDSQDVNTIRQGHCDLGSRPLFPQLSQQDILTRVGMGSQEGAVKTQPSWSHCRGTCLSRSCQVKAQR